MSRHPVVFLYQELREGRLAFKLRKNHPKQGICIYHSLEDMVRTVESVHKKFLEYKLYIRQHTADGCGTVLYAVS